MKILGISAFYHDAAAAVVQDGKIMAAAQEERFTRKKHDPDFPVNAIRYCLEETGLSIDKLDAVVFYDKPLLKFERLLETYYGFSPKGLTSFLMSMPVWLKEKLSLKKIIHDGLKQIGPYDKKKFKLLFPEHHLSHAASAFYPSPFEKAAILTIDGVGEWATASIGLGQAHEIEILKELQFPHSLGLLYSAFTYFLGFKVNSGEYKLMGLAPYGRANSAEVKRYIERIEKDLVDIKQDGSIWLNQAYFDYATGMRMAKDKAWEKLFGFPRRKAETPLEQHHCDLAYAIQTVTEKVVLLMAQEAKRLTGAAYLCMAGGVALNCVANGKLLREGIFEDIFIQSAAGDAGGALGAALAAYHIHFEQARQPVSPDAMQGAYLGPSFPDQAIERAAKRFEGVFHRMDNIASLCEKVASLIDAGEVVGWFQGRMEFGPRALGNRSILGDPRNKEMQKKLNLKIKYRESFRPFAPAVLAAAASQYFDLHSRSPYMLLVTPVEDNKMKALPDSYWQLPMKEKLYTERADLQAITHVDGSARVQTVHADTNPEFHQLLQAFQAKTGCPVLVNTSFNVRGEPIVCTPEDAYRCFMRTEMDHLVIGHYLFHKTEQPEWKDVDNWQEEFTLD